MIQSLHPPGQPRHPLELRSILGNFTPKVSILRLLFFFSFFLFFFSVPCRPGSSFHPDIDSSLGLDRIDVFSKKAAVTDHHQDPIVAQLPCPVVFLVFFTQAAA